MRDIVGLPDSNGKIVGLVNEDPDEICQNTMQFSKMSDLQKSEFGMSTTRCNDGTPFDCGPSGGAISPYTEVNAENQGVISEVPREPTFRPNDEINEKN